MFVSKRERFLWIAVAVVMAAIYLTLGLANSLATWLADTDLDAVLFLLATGLFLAMVLTEGLTKRPSGAEITVALGITAAYVLVAVRLISPVERSHLIEYGVVAILIYMALTERRNNGGRVPVPALLAIGITAALGVIDELIQLALPNRVYDPIDIVFNTMAAVMGVGLIVAIDWVRSKARGGKTT